MRSDSTCLLSVRVFGVLREHDAKLAIWLMQVFGKFTPRRDFIKLSFFVLIFVFMGWFGAWMLGQVSC